MSRAKVNTDRSAPVRILLVTTSLIVGGAENQVYLIARELKKRGHAVHVISLLPAAAYVEELAEVGVEVESLELEAPRSALSALRKFREAVRRWQPDVIHAHMFHAIFLSRLARLGQRRGKLISTMHNLEPESGFRNLAYRITDPLGSLTTSVAQAGRERYVQASAVPPHRILNIPNGIDLEQFTPRPELREPLRQELGLGNGFVWLAVGRLEEPKDYPNLFEAVRQIGRTGSSSTVLIVGDGTLTDELHAQAADLTASGAVRFLGARSDVSELMSVADAYVMSSCSEGLPLVLLEAAASGLPIVATDVGGNSEVVAHGQTGTLVPARSPQALAEAMRAMENSPYEVLRAWGAAGAERVREQFEIGQVVTLWERTYAELMEAGRAA